MTKTQHEKVIANLEADKANLTGQIQALERKLQNAEAMNQNSATHQQELLRRATEARTQAETELAALRKGFRALLESLPVLMKGA